MSFGFAIWATKVIQANAFLIVFEFILQNPIGAHASIVAARSPYIRQQLLPLLKSKQEDEVSTHLPVIFIVYVGG